jgi:hypothetical protein
MRFDSGKTAHDITIQDFEKILKLIATITPQIFHDEEFYV